MKIKLATKGTSVKPPGGNAKVTTKKTVQTTTTTSSPQGTGTPATGTSAQIKPAAAPKPKVVRKPKAVPAAGGQQPPPPQQPGFWDRWGTLVAIVIGLVTLWLFSSLIGKMNKPDQTSNNDGFNRIPFTAPVMQLLSSNDLSAATSPAATNAVAGTNVATAEKKHYVKPSQSVGRINSPDIVVENSSNTTIKVVNNYNSASVPVVTPQTKVWPQDYKVDQTEVMPAKCETFYRTVPPKQYYQYCCEQGFKLDLYIQPGSDYWMAVGRNADITGTYGKNFSHDTLGVRNNSDEPMKVKVVITRAKR